MGRRRKREDAPLSLFSFQDIMACLTGILILVALLLAIDGLADEMQSTTARGASAADAAAARSAELREQIATLRKAIDDRKGGVDVGKAEVDVLDDRVRQLAQEAERTRQRDRKAEAELSRIASERTSVEASNQEIRDRIAAAARTAQQQALRDRVRFRPGAQYAKAPVFVEATPAGISVGELDPDRVPVRIADIADPNADSRLVGALAKRLPDASYLVFVVHPDAIERFERLRDAMVRRGYEVGWQLWDSSDSAFLDGASDAKASGAASPPAGAAPAAGKGAAP